MEIGQWRQYHGTCLFVCQFENFNNYNHDYTSHMTDDKTRNVHIEIDLPTH